MRATYLALAAVLLAATAAAATTAVVTAGTPTAATAAGSSSIYDRVFQSVGVDVEPSGLYVSWEVNQSTVELARVDGPSGRIEAERDLGTQFGYLLSAAGWLWVTTVNSANAATLLRLNPTTLAVTERVALGGTGSADLAAAGGWLWVANGGKLLRLSLPGGHITAEVPLPKGTNQSMVAANAAGTVLLDGQADSGAGTVQRRDPRTGQLLASSAQIVGAVEPEVSVIGSGVWMSEPSGMTGYVERLDLTTLKPTPLVLPAPDPEGDHTYIEGTNGIGATVADGLVWITQDQSRFRYNNYCADPGTGRELAAIPFPHPYDDSALAIGSSYIYYGATSSPGLGQSERLGRIPLPARCLTTTGQLRN
jgi:hypothetical protein